MGVKEGALEWLRGLVVEELDSLGTRLEFRGRVLECRGEAAISTCAVVASSGGRGKAAARTLYFKRSGGGVGGDDPDATALAGVVLYDVAAEVVRGLFSEEEAASRLASVDFLLTQPVAILRRRGVLVDRFLTAAPEPVAVQRPMAPPAVPRAAVDFTGHDDDEVEGGGGHAGGKQPALRVPQFGGGGKGDAAALLKRSGGAGAFTGRMPLRDRGQEGEEHACDCELSVSPHGATFPHGIQLYVTADAAGAVSPGVLAAGAVFAELLATLARAVFGMKGLKGVRMFLDVAEPLIAFNRCGGLYFNLRYFMQCHAVGKKATPPPTVAMFWYVTMCHE
ncbi:MAG: hypothetical protein P4L83_20465, partial [Nevskia sp.]|nr:hypothetical protein [Nevskia sp.]